LGPIGSLFGPLDLQILTAIYSPKCWSKRDQNPQLAGRSKARHELHDHQWSQDKHRDHLRTGHGSALIRIFAMQHPEFPMMRSTTEHPHTGLIHLGLIHGRHASQRMGLVATSLVTHTQSRTLLRRATNHRQRRWPVQVQRLCLLDCCD